MNASRLLRSSRHRVALGNFGLLIVMIVGAAYLAVHVMRVGPFHSTYTVRVEMSESGGLQPNNDVTYRGWRVGRVRNIDFTPDGVVAVADIDAGTLIPANGTAAVNRLSAAGEQYLDLRPSSANGPYLADGALIDASRVSVPVTVQAVLTDVTAMIDGINPDRLEVIVNELDKALAGGPNQLRDMVSGLSQALAGMDSLLPQTTKLIENLQVIAGTTSRAQPDLATLAHNGGILFGQLTAADQELRRLLDLGPGQLATLDGVIRATDNPITNLLTNAVVITKAAQLRTPAMTALFPAMRGYTHALGVPAHDGEFHALADILPRPTCDYPTIPIPAEVPANTRTRLYNYCETDNPALQIRGSADAPRPDGGDNTAGPPPRTDLGRLSSPDQPVPRN